MSSRELKRVSFLNNSIDDNSDDEEVALKEEEDFSETTEEDEKAKSKRLKREFYLFSISVLFTMCSYAGLLDLQSSINVEGALGNTALTLTSVTTILLCFTLTPLVVMKAGAKKTIIISQGCYLIYVLANFYPAIYTLLPAGVSLGVGEALLHTPALMYCTYYGRSIAQCSGKSKKDSVNRYIGFFSGIFQMNEIFSNLISFVILGIGRYLATRRDQEIATALNIVQSNNFTNLSVSNITMQTSPMHPTSSLNVIITSQSASLPMQSTMAPTFETCGANDCYVEEVFDATIENFVPVSKASFYIMVCVYSLLGISAMPIMMLIPALPTTKSLQKQAMLTDKTKEEHTSSIPTSSAFKLVMINIQDTLCHLVDLQQILLTPLTLYHGLYIAFISSEINRAFVSCTVGVERVGIGMFVGGIMNTSICFLFGAIAGRVFLRNFCVAVAITLDLALYTFCLYWKPTEDTAWFAYVICLLFGATDGVWEPFLDGKYAKYFSDNEEVAYSVFIIWTCAGYAMTYGWTAVFCLREKLYIQIVVLVIGVVCCGVAERLQRKKKMKESNASLA